MVFVVLTGQVSEASVSRNRSTIIVPAGSNRDEGWTAFRNILAEINEASRLFILPNQVSAARGRGELLIMPFHGITSIVSLLTQFHNVFFCPN